MDDVKRPQSQHETRRDEAAQDYVEALRRQADLESYQSLVAFDQTIIRIYCAGWDAGVEHERKKWNDALAERSPEGQHDE